MTENVEGRGTPALEAEGELSLARVALAERDVRHAATHLGNALACDPSHLPCYAFIGELVEVTGGLDEAKDLFELDESAHVGVAAVRADLHARAGESKDAISLLVSVTVAAPDQGWAAAPWFGPRLADVLSDRQIADAAGHLIRALADPAPAELRAPLAPWLELVRASVARPGTDPAFVTVMSGLARRLGAVDEAIDWCRSAVERDAAAGTPTPTPLIMLGYAYRTAQRPQEASATWQRALAIDPGNLDLHIDLAELALSQGDQAGAIAWAERAAALDPEHVKPRAIRLQAMVRAREGAIEPLIELADLARSRPDEPYPTTCLRLACARVRWLNQVPAPTEAIINLARNFLEKQPLTEDSSTAELRVSATAIEAPSATAAFFALFPKSELAVDASPEPDIRVPARTDCGPPIWAYEGMTAVATVPPASPIAVEKLYHTVQGLWPDPLAAYDRAVGLAGLDAPELLGLLAHLPPSPKAEPWSSLRSSSTGYWERLAQAWVCVGILHLRPEEPWLGSARRGLLLRLLFGPDDWTVDAAAFALCVSGWMFPDQRADVAGAVAARYLTAVRALGRRPTELHDPLAQVLLLCPGVEPETAALARDMLARSAAERDQ